MTLVLRAECSIQKLEILFPRKESVLTGHPDTSNNMILDEAT